MTRMAPLPPVFQRRREPDLVLNPASGPFRQIEISFDVRAEYVHSHRSKSKAGFETKKMLLDRVERDYALSPEKARLDHLATERAAALLEMQLAEAKASELESQRRQTELRAEPGCAGKVIELNSQADEQRAIVAKKTEELAILDRMLVEARAAAESARIEIGRRHYTAMNAERQRRYDGAIQALQAILDAQLESNDLQPLSDYVDDLRRLPDAK